MTAYRFIPLVLTLLAGVAVLIGCVEVETPADPGHSTSSVLYVSPEGSDYLSRGSREYPVRSRYR